MNESKKRTLFITVLFLAVLICLFAIFLLQMNMQRTLAQIAAIQATNTQVAVEVPTTSSAVPTESETAAESQEESIRSIWAESSLSASPAKTTVPSAKSEKVTTTKKPKQLSEQLVVNTNTKKIHSPDCSYAKNIKPENRADISAGDLQSYLENGYALCGHCEGCAK